MGIRASDEELEELRKVAVSGVQSIESDGRKVVYRSLDDQLRVLNEAADANAGKPRRRFASHSRGYK